MKYIATESLQMVKEEQWEAYEHGLGACVIETALLIRFHWDRPLQR